MKLVQQHIIKSNHKDYKKIMNLLHLSKNLYNTALYNIRQYYFKSKDDTSVKYKYLNYYENFKQLIKHDDYRILHGHISQQILKQVDQNFKSFYALLCKKRSGDYTQKVHIPKYLDKDGYNQIIVTDILKKPLKYNCLRIPRANIDINVGEQIQKFKKIKQFRLIPKNGYIILEVIYEVKDRQLKQDNGKYLGIDLGIDNLATCISNDKQINFIVNGKVVKSINQFYNKKLSQLKSQLEKDNKQKTSKKIQKLTLDRNNKIKDYFHKASRYIVNQTVNQSLNTIIIGYNKGWKQETNIGKKNNQNFVQIPHNILISQISYKAQLSGINVLIQEESYTSKCSFLDNESIEKHDEYIGKRIKRGLFKGSSCLINADTNGALNIMKKKLKVASDDLIDPGSRGFVYNPLKVTL